MTSYNTFKASIPSFSTSRDEKKPFTLYNLVFQLGEQTWNTSVRYSTIRALHEAVKLKYPSIKVPKLPGKKLVGNDNAEFIEKRRAKLEQYLQELLSFPLVRGSPEVMQYFNLNSRIGLVPRAFTMYSPSSPIAPGSGSGIQSPQSRQPSSQQRGMNRGGASSSKSIRAIALYDYSTEEEDPTADLLPFSANDTIKDIILDDDGSGWYYGTLEMNGTKGFFPGNYVKILQDGAEEEEVPATATAASSSAVAAASSSATFAATGAVGAAGTAVAASAAAQAAQRNASAVSRQQQPQQPQITTMVRLFSSSQLILLIGLVYANQQARGGTMIGSRELGVGSPGRASAAQNKQPFGPKIAGVDRAALGGNRPSAKTVVSPTSPRAVLESGSGILAAPTAPATTATASSNKGGSAIFGREAPSASSDIKVSPASPSGSAIHAKAWAEGNPNESKRTNIAMEIVATEEKYVENLSWLCKDYYEALEKLMKEGHSALNPEVLKAVFCNSLTILNLNQGLLADLQAIRKTWSDETTLLGQAFRKWIPFMKMYKEYGNNFDRANEMCNKLREHGQIVAVLDATKNRCQQLTLDALLITPIQRLPRYNLLLTVSHSLSSFYSSFLTPPLVQDLLRNTPESHPDYQNIKAALEEMSAVADSINESIKEAEQSRKFGHLAQRGAGFGVLLEAHRRLVMEAKFATKQGVKSKTIQLHLFNDVLVPARITRNEANPVIVIPLNLTWLAEDEDPASTSFTVISPDQPFTFFAESVVEKNKWRAAILEGIKNNLQPLQGLLESDAKTTNDNLAFRFGDYEYMDGGAYQGAWNVGMRHGIGRLTYFSGNVYDGAWHSNLRHGVGTLTYITGEVYEGQWEKDRPSKSFLDVLILLLNIFFFLLIFSGCCSLCSLRLFTIIY
ncbi:guanine nucleotide exchange factor 9 [Balamuthia mandrillaris]